MNNEIHLLLLICNSSEIFVFFINLYVLMLHLPAGSKIITIPGMKNWTVGAGYFYVVLAWRVFGL